MPLHMRRLPMRLSMPLLVKISRLLKMPIAGPLPLALTLPFAQPIGLPLPLPLALMPRLLPRQPQELREQTEQVRPELLRTAASPLANPRHRRR